MTDKDRVPVHPFLCWFRNSGMSRAGLGYNRAMVSIQLVFRIIRLRPCLVYEDTCELLQEKIVGRRVARVKIDVDKPGDRYL